MTKRARRTSVPPRIMAQARTSKGASHEASTIGAGTRVRGRVTGDGDVVVAGNVEGDIAVRGDVTIDDGAQCTSNVEGHAVSIDGALEGDVAASGAISIGASGRVRGNVRGASFAMDDGASFAGRVDCDFELPAGLGESPRGRR
jgi:cytoskeletal protein CcmA (bactofilin family)